MEFLSARFVTLNTYMARDPIPSSQTLIFATHQIVSSGCRRLKLEIAADEHVRKVRLSTFGYPCDSMNNQTIYERFFDPYLDANRHERIWKMQYRRKA